LSHGFAQMINEVHQFFAAPFLISDYPCKAVAN
jgi:hypothetical protein